MVLISQCGPDFMLPYIIEFLLFLFTYLYLNRKGGNILLLHPGPSAGLDPADSTCGLNGKGMEVIEG